MHIFGSFKNKLVLDVLSESMYDKRQKFFVFLQSYAVITYQLRIRYESVMLNDHISTMISAVRASAVEYATHACRASRCVTWTAATINSPFPVCTAGLNQRLPAGDSCAPDVC